VTESCFLSSINTYPNVVLVPGQLWLLIILFNKKERTFKQKQYMQKLNR